MSFFIVDFIADLAIAFRLNTISWSERRFQLLDPDMADLSAISKSSLVYLPAMQSMSASGQQ
jgi:hypothetical protein